MTVPRPTGVGPSLQHRGPCSLPRAEQQGPPQALPPWEGPYVVAEVLRPGAYKLKTIDGKVFNNAWNIEQLRRFYP